jgi:hypothetical protein
VLSDQSLLILNSRAHSYFLEDYPVVKYNKVFEYECGMGFGDLALTNDQPRSASLIVISSYAEFITLTKSDYKVFMYNPYYIENQRQEYPAVQRENNLFHEALRGSEQVERRQVHRLLPRHHIQPQYDSMEGGRHPRVLHHYQEWALCAFQGDK